MEGSTMKPNNKNKSRNYSFLDEAKRLHQQQKEENDRCEALEEACIKAVRNFGIFCCLKKCCGVSDNVTEAYQAQEVRELKQALDDYDGGPKNQCMR